MNKNLLLALTLTLTGCVTLAADPDTNRPKLSLRLGDVACALKAKRDGAMVRCTKPFGIVEHPHSLLKNE